MRSEFTAVFQPAKEGGYWACCAEVPETNGQGETLEDCRENLAQAIDFVLEVRRDDGLRGVPAEAMVAAVPVA